MVLNTSVYHQIKIHKESFTSCLWEWPKKLMIGPSTVIIPLKPAAAGSVGLGGGGGVFSA